MNAQECQKTLNTIAENLGKVILGKADKIELMIMALLAGGHILLEDIRSK